MARMKVANAQPPFERGVHGAATSALEEAAQQAVAPPAAKAADRTKQQELDEEQELNTSPEQQQEEEDERDDQPIPRSLFKHVYLSYFDRPAPKQLAGCGGQLAPTSAPLAPLAPKGMLTVQKHLGSGGFATVYLAEDHATGRQFALKVLNRPMDVASSLAAAKAAGAAAAAPAAPAVQPAEGTGGKAAAQQGSCPDSFTPAAAAGDGYGKAGEQQKPAPPKGDFERTFDYSTMYREIRGYAQLGCMGRGDEEAIPAPRVYLEGEPGVCMLVGDPEMAMPCGV